MPVRIIIAFFSAFESISVTLRVYRRSSLLYCAVRKSRLRTVGVLASVNSAHSTVIIGIQSVCGK